MSSTSNNKTIDPFFVRAQFDEILAEKITSFIQIDSESVLLSYNLATIACLVIAVERERDLSGSMDFLPERLTKQSFIEELAEIGLEKDEGLEKAVDSVIEMGFLSVDSQGKLKAEVSAFITTGFLDVMFPGMPGMNLVAFVMQMNDEVISGRKTLEYAKTSFIETLKSRGVAVTSEKAEQVKSDVSVKKLSTGLKKTSNILKKANAKKIARIKLRKQSNKPSFYSRSGYVSDNVKVKSLFDKGPTDEEVVRAAEQAEAEKKQKEEKQKAKELAEMEERIRKAEEKAEQAEKKARELAMHEEELKAAKKAEEEAEKKALELKKLEAEKAAEKMAAELKAMEKKLKAAEEERAIMEQAGGENFSDIKSNDDNSEGKVSPSDDIEARIAAFEAELAMPCPLCQTGKVITEKTSAGKDYYTCSDKDCRFVSWDKPYHFSCPQCKNPYLVEFDLPAGEKGLKCPRAGCSYKQENLLDPAQNLALKAEKKIPKKKKRVVRRVRRRR